MVGHRHVIFGAGLVNAAAVLRECLLREGRAVPDDVLAEVERAEWSKVCRAAALHRVTPAAFLGLRESHMVPDEAMCSLQADYEISFRRHLACWELLQEVTDLFEEAGITYVAVKGPVLAERVYPRSDLRSYGDLDLLVGSSQFADALRVLEATGATLYEANWELMLHTLRGELNLLTRFGVAVDLHWSLLHEFDTRNAFRLPANDLLERARREVVADRSVGLLDPNDELLHLCAHACLEGGWRLSWLQDIRLAATRLAIDWAVVAARAEASGLGLVAAVMLDRVNRCFGSDFPVDRTRVRDFSRKGPWLEVVRALDRVRPPWKWYGSQLSGRLLVASTRSDSRASARALVASTRREVAALVHEPEHPWRRGRSRATVDRQVPEMLRPQGGARGREAFLTAVARAELT